MNREIKFRGKQTVTGKWIYGDLSFATYFLKDEMKPFILNPIDVRECGYNTYHYEVISETIGQYTGLKDKNGKEIYEGDIVEFLDTGEEGYEYKEGYDFNNIASIVWENGRFELDNIYDNNSAVLEFMNNESHEEFIDELMSDCQIIGNVFENSELLEVTNGQH